MRIKLPCVSAACGTIAAMATFATPALAQDGAFLDNGGSSRGGITYARSSVVPQTTTVRRGDTLWDLAHRYYGDPYDWPRLWSYNPEITNPHWIYPDAHVRLRADGEGPPAAVSLNPGRRNSSVYLREEGFLDRRALERAGTVVGSVHDHMLLTVGDEFYVEVPEPQEFAQSSEYTIFHPVPETQRNDGERGVLVKIDGTARLESIDQERKVARLVITEALDPIERGQLVADVPRRFRLVGPRESTQDLDAHVIATLRQRSILGDQDLVFLDVGERQNIEIGDRFFVVRSVDEWRRSLDGTTNDVGSTVERPREPRAYPETYIAELRIVDVRENNAAAWVISARQELVVGELAYMRVPR